VSELLKIAEHLKELLPKENNLTEQATEPARIVMVEDNAADVAILRHVLDTQRKPYVLEVLSDGEQALRFIRDHTPQAIPRLCLFVLDLYLPRHSGMEVLSAIRRADALLHVAVLTGGVLSPMEQAELARFNLCSIRTKPTDLAEYMKVGEQFMEICRQQSSSASG
jgi:CheY-like chemotaxis protein